MQVTLIAQTAVLVQQVEQFGFEVEPGARAADVLAEFAGRACYQSFHKPNPATRKVADYLRHILEVGHLSVLEHASATFYLTGISRSLTHELIRHRHFSYSQRSQRYVDESGAETVVPPAYAADGFEDCERIVRDTHDLAKRRYETLAEDGESLGLNRKQARQAARAVLPSANETRIVVTGNYRAWLEFLSKRWNEAADEEIKDLAGLILIELSKLAPGITQNVPTAPYPAVPPPVVTRAEMSDALQHNGLDDYQIRAILDAAFEAKT